MKLSLSRKGLIIGRAHFVARWAKGEDSRWWHKTESGGTVTQLCGFYKMSGAVCFACLRFYAFVWVKPKAVK